MWITQLSLLLLDAKMPYDSLPLGCEEHIDLVRTVPSIMKGKHISLCNMLDLLYLLVNIFVSTHKIRTSNTHLENGA